MGKLKTCTKCNESLPATPEHFHRNRSTKDGFVWRCKACANLATQQSKRRVGLVKGVSAKALESEAIKKEEVEMQKYSKGKYKVIYEGGMHKRGVHTFTGEIIQQTKDFITLVNENGIAESFLKVDFLIDSKIERIV